MTQQSDQSYLLKALELAKIRRGFCTPNPSVGAVIVRDGTILATGYHYAAGFPHAEVDALNKISHQAQNATMYVTLEPCCHFGRTPPCTDALIQAGIKRVVYGYSDPNPIVANQSEPKLTHAGIQSNHLNLPEVNEFYESYRYWQNTKKPFVTAKIALSLDGKIAGKNGVPIQITGHALKEFTHLKRKASDAILTTIKTILRDDPQLNARYQNEIIAKPIYILDSQLQFPIHSKIISTAKSLTFFHAQNAPASRIQQLITMGFLCIPVDQDEYGLNLNQIIDIIGKEGIQDLWVEAGGNCFTSLVEQKLLQKAFIYIAPWVIGEGVAAFRSELDFRECKIEWKQFEHDVLCEIRW